MAFTVQLSAFGAATILADRRNCYFAIESFGCCPANDVYGGDPVVITTDVGDAVVSGLLVHSYRSIDYRKSLPARVFCTSIH